MKKYIKENKRLLLNALLSIVVLILILTIVLYYQSKKETYIESFNNAVLATIENAKLLEIEDEYILVNFPDEDNIISKHGKIKKSNNKKYNEFTNGYIIIYKDGSYAFKLTDGSYCATKDFNQNDVNIDIYAECEDYTIEYKIKEES